jgi:O-antigen ligase
MINTNMRTFLDSAALETLSLPESARNAVAESARQRALASRLRTGQASARELLEVNTAVRWAFYLFVFSIPLEYPDRTIPLEVHTITGSLFLAVTLAQSKLCFRRPPAAFWCLAVYLWLYVAIGVFSEHFAEAAKLFLNYLLVAFLFWVGGNLMRRHLLSRAVLWSFVLGCALVGSLNVLGIATRVVETDDTVRRIVFGQDANLLGGNMALALVALMALTFSGQTKLVHPRVILGAAVAFPLAKCLMLAGSRGALLALVAGVVAFTFQTASIRSFSRNGVVALLAVAALAMVMYRSDSMLKRYQKTLTTGSMSGREQIYPEAWKMFLERPVFGWGPIDNTYELGLRTAGFSIGKHNADGRTSKADKDTHNLVLDVLTSMGLLGGLPLFMCLTVCACAAWTARGGPHGTTPFALVVVVLVLSMDANWSASKQGWIVLAYAAASGRVSMTSARRTNLAA